MSSQTLVLIDGENLVKRYEDMLTDAEAPVTPSEHNAYIPGVFVWNNRLCGFPVAPHVLRVIMYVTVTGDRQGEMASKIREQMFAYGDSVKREWQRLTPVVIKKPKDRPAKEVDIQICVDALENAAKGNMQELVLVTGDADSAPLARSVMRLGIRVHLRALSKGCSEVIREVGDSFTPLDSLLFKS